MTERFIDRVYTLKSPAEARALYDAWAAEYEAEMDEQGYATPDRAAAALASIATDPTIEILDFACGTGLSGQALNQAGFTAIDGVDLSADMLAVAAAKGIYRELFQIEPGAVMPGAPGRYGAITAIGAIGAGAAPISTFDTISAALAPGGLFALSFNDHTADDPNYSGRLTKAIETGEMRLRFREHGPHLPGIDLKSTVYVLEKA